MNTQSDYAKRLQALARQLTQLAHDHMAHHITEPEARNIEHLLLTRRLHTLNRAAAAGTDQATVGDSRD